MEDRSYNLRIMRLKAEANPAHLGLKLRSSGRTYVCACPFHVNNPPEMRFYNAFGHWRYKCFHCGNGGNLIQYVQKTRFKESEPAEGFNKSLQFWDNTTKLEDFPEIPGLSSNAPMIRMPAIKEEGEDHLIARVLFAEYCHLEAETNDIARDFLKRKGWDWEEAFYYGIGYYSGDSKPFYAHCWKYGVDPKDIQKGLDNLRQYKKPRLTIPALNENHELYTVFGRSLEDNSNTKYAAFVSYPTRIPFNITKHVKNPILVEGIFDALKADHAGIEGVMAIIDNYLTLEKCQTLISNGAKSITLILDNDVSNHEVIEKRIEESKRICEEFRLEFRSVILPPGFDPDSYIRQVGADGLLKIIEDSEMVNIHSKRIATQLDLINMEYDKNQRRETGKLSGYSLNRFPRLADNLDGVQAGYYFIAANPNLGKSTLLLNLAVDLINSNKMVKVIYIVLDKPATAVINPWIACKTDIPLRVVQRRVNDPEIQARIQKGIADLKESIEDNRLELWDTSTVHNERELRELLYEESRAGYQLVICIDGLYNLKLEELRERRESHIRRSAAIKDLTEDLHIPIICTGHLSDTVEIPDDHKPTLADLKLSSAYGTDADVVLFLWGSAETTRGEKKLALTLSRNTLGGRRRSMALNFDHSKSQIWEPPVVPGAKEAQQ
jgi:hypothetical protein